MNHQSANYVLTKTEHQLKVSFSQRNYGHFLGNDDDGVVSLDCPEQVRQALDTGYPQLTTRWGWSRWKNLRVRDVLIRDLGPGLFGIAGLVGRDSGQMVISPRSFDPLPDLIKLRRQGTVIHELVHLLQFQSPLFQHFYNPARLGAWDPNWWLHEASALAAEISLVPAYPTPFIRLWEWATKPHLSLDTDENGYRALPFLLYLMDNVSEQLPAKLYEQQQAHLSTMLAIEALANELTANGTDLATEFMNYCVAVSPLEDPQRAPWIASISQIVGPRAYRERFRDYPVTNTLNVPVDHLGCRYFRFKPNSASGSKLTIRVANVTHPAALHARLSVVSRHDGHIRHHVVSREGDELVVQVEGFSADQVSYAVLTIANCAAGVGWANFDNNRFSLMASMKSHAQ